MNHCHTHDKDKEYEYFLKKIKKVGGRITKQRAEVVKAILSFEGPFSAEQLLKAVGKFTIDLATVYRSLTKFQELGLLSSIDFADGMLRYEYLSDEGHHHHIVCKKCRVVKPVKCSVIKVQDNIFEKLGYKDLSHKLEFFGLCRDCS